MSSMVQLVSEGVPNVLWSSTQKRVLEDYACTHAAVLRTPREYTVVLSTTRVI